MSAIKHDNNKPQLDLIPPTAILALAKVLDYGATKYSPRNWENGMRWGRVYAACLRHLFSWWAGKGTTNKSFLFDEVDDETQYSHLWHALACIVFLVCYEEWNRGEDDRPKKQSATGWTTAP